MKQTIHADNQKHTECGAQLDQPQGSRGLKRILAASQLGTGMDRALLRAVQLASEHGATLEILHPRSVPADQTLSAEEIDLKLKPTLKALGLPPPVIVEQASGSPVVEILRRARQGDADLIVAGEFNLRPSAFRRNIAVEILRGTERPLVIVKRTPRFPYRRVLVAVDFSEPSGCALQFALRLVPRAKFHVLHAYHGIEHQLWRTDVEASRIMRYRRELANNAREQMRAVVNSVGRDRRNITTGIWFGRAAHAITAASERLRADLVVVGTASRTGLPRLFIGSVAEHVMQHVSCDVLVVRSQPTVVKVRPRSRLAA